jgi:lambda family phage portal protein
MSTIRPWYNAQRVTVPTGTVVPDIKAKRSLILDAWNAKRQQGRAEAVQRDRLQQQARSYEGAAVNRLTGDWSALNTSADSEILTSLRVLRARSRQLVRDNPYAKQAVRLIVNNVIGAGIGMQAQVSNARKKLLDPINDSIEAAWVKWCDRKTCHTAGLLNFSDIERLAVTQLVTAGEVVIRKIRTPFGGGTVPLALEVLEADRLMDQWQTARAPNGNMIRMGVEVDEWHRPTAYWFLPKHPGDYQFATFDPAKFLRVPADDVLHLYIIDRWPQTRGEPWFHAALRTMHDVGGYEEAEIVKARSSANVVGFIRSPEPLAPDGTQNGRQVLNTEPGTWQTLLPGEDVAGFNSAAPNPTVEPFLRYMLRKIAVAVGTSYEGLSRDYSQSNYSSSRLALLDDRDVYRVIQGWFCKTFRADIHREFLDAAALVGAVKLGQDYFSNTDKYTAVRFKPRGWAWIDPAREVAAYKMAERCGYMTKDDVISTTHPSADFEDVMKGLQREREFADDLDLVLDTDPAKVNDKGQAQGAAGADGAAPGAGAEGEDPGAKTGSDVGLDKETTEPIEA